MTPNNSLPLEEKIQLGRYLLDRKVLRNAFAKRGIDPNTLMMVRVSPMPGEAFTDADGETIFDLVSQSCRNVGGPPPLVWSLFGGKVLLAWSAKPTATREQLFECERCLHLQVQNIIATAWQRAVVVLNNVN